MKRVFAVILGLVLAFCGPMAAYADHIEGDTGWYVEYDAAGNVVDNYTQKSWADNVSQLQPGDDITLSVMVRETNDASADWYMSNEVLKTLEEGDATGSAYGYTLSYEGPSNSRTLFTSKNVGGIGSAEGLAEATNAMDDYFFLGTLAKGENGRVVLNVALDGETEGNAYFDTLAQLKLKFAVEPNVGAETVTKNETVEKKETVTTTEPDNVVNRVVSGSRQNLAKTGDQTSQLPVYLLIAGVGILCLALAIRNIRNKKNENKENGGAQ